MKYLFTLLATLLLSRTYAQTDTASGNFSISSYLETFYSYDFDQPTNHLRPGFLYSYNRHNEVNLNLGLIKASYTADRVRANLGLMAGTYANTNLAAEPGVLKNVYEANVGVKLSRKKELWIDMGILPSHIGFESAIGKDCWTLTRSILADNSPYYEAGARLSYQTSNGKWFMSLLALNGWQRIQRLDGNNSIALGHQITFKPTEAITLNSSSFVGNDQPDSSRQMRYFHNLYGTFKLGNTLGLTAGLDIGAQQQQKGSSRYNAWYAPVLIARAALTKQQSLAARMEYYQDRNSVLISYSQPFATWGYSVNYDYAVTSNLLWRMEARAFSGSIDNFCLTTSLAFAF